MIHLVLYQPEIPQNTGTLIRLAACLGIGLDIVEPCGFVWSDSKLKRAGLDYHDLACVQRYPTWEAFQQETVGHRLVLVDSTASQRYDHFTFYPTDRLLMGRESNGFPLHLKETISHQVRIPMCPQARSLNMAIAAAMVVGEALRQNGGFDDISFTGR